MSPAQRQQLLKLAAIILPALYLFDLAVIEPAIHAWEAQSERIEALEKKVTRGRSLLAREKTLRGRWADMQRANLSSDISIAESDAINALNRWQLASGVSLTSTALQWQTHEDSGYDDFECRATLTGDLVKVGRFVYELETDPAPVNLEECEIASRDAHGQQITMSARFSFVRLGPDAGTPASNPAPGGRGGNTGRAAQ